MSNSHITEMKAVSIWQSTLSQQPSDVLKVNASDFKVLTAKATYLSLSADSKSATEKESDDSSEWVKVEKYKQGFVFLSYDSDARANVAWSSTEFGSAGKQALNIEDPADIFYSTAKDKLYGRYASRELFVYDFATGSTASFLDGKSASDMCLSANGNYIAIQDKDENIEVIDLNTNEVVSTYTAKEGGSSSLVGVTNTGKLLVFELNTAEKNATEASFNRIIIQNAAAPSTILELNAGWAKLLDKQLFVWAENDKGQMEFHLYDLADKI